MTMTLPRNWETLSTDTLTALLRDPPPLRQPVNEAYEKGGGRLRPVVMVRGSDDMWRSFNGTPQTSFQHAERLAEAVFANNSESQLNSVDVLEAVPALVYVYRNGQICAGIMALEPVDLDEEASDDIWDEIRNRDDEPPHEDTPALDAPWWEQR